MHVLGNFGVFLGPGSTIVRFAIRCELPERLTSFRQRRPGQLSDEVAGRRCVELVGRGRLRPSNKALRHDDARKSSFNIVEPGGVPPARRRRTANEPSRAVRRRTDARPAAATTKRKIRRRRR